MFIFTLTYLKPLNEVDKYLQQHIDYHENHYQSGHFIASGRKVPRTGGGFFVVQRIKNKR